MKDHKEKSEGKMNKKNVDESMFTGEQAWEVIFRKMKNHIYY